MEPSFFKPLHFRLSWKSLHKKLCLKEGNPYLQDLIQLVEEAGRIGRPKALYKLSFIDEKGEDYVIVDGAQPQKPCPPGQPRKGPEGFPLSRDLWNGIGGLGESDRRISSGGIGLKPSRKWPCVMPIRSWKNIWWTITDLENLQG